MELFEEQFEVLAIKGKAQGYLTLDEINDCLPDADFSPESVDELLIKLDLARLSKHRPRYRASNRPRRACQNSVTIQSAFI